MYIQYMLLTGHSGACRLEIGRCQEGNLDPVDTDFLQCFERSFVRLERAGPSKGVNAEFHGESSFLAGNRHCHGPWSLRTLSTLDTTLLRR